MRLASFSVAAALAVFLAPALAQSQGKPAITLDEYLNTTEITDARLSPDGTAAVIGTEAPDWKNSVYRSDLWLWTAQAGLQPLTHSGSEENPQWSPDGKWIAFVSDRALPGEDAASDGDPASDSNGNSDKASRIWLIRATGGEALPLYTEELDVHAFAWAPDGASIYFTATLPLTSEEKETHTAEWHDVVRWREQYRGDVVLKLAVAPALV
ncbi:MAG TPA: DPP IV N-terminal domain-containing protein, partial [Terracidiphilus sp.]|nr:DPP IV N-terminal domain-containing protein [Terracidiphilus sp.]